MDATYCKAHPKACSGSCHIGELGSLIDRTKGGQNAKLHGICEGNGRLFNLLLMDVQAITKVWKFC